MLRRRYSIELVSKTQGHADISTTYPIYCHVLMTERREHVVGLLGNFLLSISRLHSIILPKAAEF